MRSLKTKDGRVIIPYSYQKTSFKLLVTALTKYRRALMVMATGLGKTITALLILLHFLRPKSRVLFLCHDTGILDQAHDEFKNIIDSKYSFTKFYGDKKDWDADTHNIVFATVQSLASHLFNPKSKNIFSRRHFDYILMDEAHHAKAETYEQVLEYFQPRWKMAMTATPERDDEEDITEIFGKPVVNIELPEAIAKGWLTPVEYKLLSDGINEEVIRQLVGDVIDNNVRITEKEINKKLFIRVRTQEQIKEILKESVNKQAIIFCRNITHLKHVAKLLPSSVYVHSKRKTDENNKAIKQFKERKVRHILVVDKFNEGIDIPDVELIVFLRGTSSRRIFFQQLGRGLRKLLGKKKVTILDFVGNVRRIQDVKDLVERIESISLGKQHKRGPKTGPLHVKGTGFTFNFTEETVNILRVFERSQEDYYPTWQEASKAAIKLGIKSGKEYVKAYKKDSKLPSSPREWYPKFPGWDKFLEKSQKYKTWQEASKAAIKLGIKDTIDYYKKCKKDERLYFDPIDAYEDFPGFRVFLGLKGKYPTWQEASKAAIKLKAKNGPDYRKKFKKDSRLHCYPEKFYKDFPGWPIFLKTAEKYKTWQEASKAAIKLGIKDYVDYKSKYKKDKCLPSHPKFKYKNFPGWDVYLGKKKK
jgi:superfamily II DNA or RNA helicase